MNHEMQPLPELTAKIDQHWSQLNTWFEESNPIAVQEIVDICNADDVDDFVAMVNHDPQRARFTKTLARLAIYEAYYRQRVRMEQDAV